MPTFLLIQGSWNNIVEKFEGADEQSLQTIFDTARAIKASTSWFRCWVNLNNLLIIITFLLEDILIF